MKRDTKRLSDNVNRILQLGRLEDRDVKAEFRDEDVVSVINDFIKNTPHLFDEGRVVFDSTLESYFMQIDFALFEMLLMNLVTNAFIYNKSREKVVTIKLEVIGKNLVMDIIDNGIGVDKVELRKIFRKFYQVGKTTKGSGLGLYIVQSIAKHHKGEITAFSDGIGKGTTFRIIFKGTQ